LKPKRSSITNVWYRKRQVQQAADGYKSRQQRDLLCQPVSKPARHRLVQGRQPPSKVQRQRWRAPRQFNQAKPRFGNGVVGRFLVRGQSDFCGEGGRNFTAVYGDMANLAASQPEFQQEVGTKCQGKDDGCVEGRCGAVEEICHCVRV
jgi:hypothetical protein